MKLLTIAVSTFFGLMAAAPDIGIASPNACRAAIKLTTNGIEMYCPTTQCPDGFECTQNGSDSTNLWWCACGVGGKASADCQAVWKENEDGSLDDFECLNLDCNLTCKKATYPQEIGQAVYACNCS